MKQIAAMIIYLICFFIMALMDKYVFGGTGNLSNAVVGCLIVGAIAAQID